MDPADRIRHRQEKELYTRALELPPGEREAWVTAHAVDAAMAAAVLQQLRHASSTGDAGLVGAVRKAAAAAITATVVPLPERIGPYRILGELGHGGQGVVYRAEQTEPVRRQVALKVIRSSNPAANVLARFDLERRTLAAMSHRGIAKVFDAGATAQGEPYVVMELIEGKPLTEFCDAEQLPLAARLRLFQEVCDAVQHAHNKGVVHRDLKPANILVVREGEQAVPRILDFGMAKIVDGNAIGSAPQLTGDGLLGTLEYMSPEQAGTDAGALDVRSDIYSLGVILYELLCGELPFAAAELRSMGIVAAVTAIREQEPARPSLRLARSGEHAAVAGRRGTSSSALQRALAGDLDWVVACAMAKEPARRYATATELAADLGRYLAQRPVQAGPPSAGYRLRKFVRRNRTMVAAAAVASIAVVVAGIGIWRAYGRAEHEAAVASFELAERYASRGSWEEAIAAYDRAEQNGYPGAFALQLGRTVALESVDREDALAALPGLEQVASTPAEKARLLLLRAGLETDFSKKPDSGLALLTQARDLHALSPADDYFAQAMLEPDLHAAFALLQSALAAAPDNRGALQLALPLSMFAGTAQDTWIIIKQYGLLFPSDPALPFATAAAALLDDRPLDVANLERLINSSTGNLPNGANIADALLRVVRFVNGQRAVLANGWVTTPTGAELQGLLGDLGVLFSVTAGQSVGRIVHPSLGRMWPHVLRFLGALMWHADPSRPIAAMAKLLPDPYWSFLQCNWHLDRGEVAEARRVFETMGDGPSVASRVLGSAVWANLRMVLASQLVLREANSRTPGQPIGDATRRTMLAWIDRAQRTEEPSPYLLGLMPDGASVIGDHMRALETSLLWYRHAADDPAATYRLAKAFADAGDRIVSRRLFARAIEQQPTIDRDIGNLDRVERWGRTDYVLPELERMLQADKQRFADDPAKATELDEVHDALAWLYATWDRLSPKHDYDIKAASYRRGKAKPR